MLCNDSHDRFPSCIYTGLDTPSNVSFLAALSWCALTGLPLSFPLGSVSLISLQPPSLLFNTIHMMYEVRKMPLHADGKPPGEVVSLSTIRQSCQLIPRFPRPTSVDGPPTKIPEDWHSHNVLDRASHFLLNNWATKYVYQTLW